MKKKTINNKLSLDNFQIAKLSNSQMIRGGGGGIGDGDISDDDPLKPTKCLKGSEIIVTSEDDIID